MKNPYFDISEKAEQKRILCDTYAQKFFPLEKIKLLIVGESPPLTGAYFYIPENLRRRHQGLPAKIFRALFNADTKIDEEQCKYYLQEFQKHNFLLLDLLSFPVDCFVSTIRIEFIGKHISDFINRYNSLELSKSCNKILILPSGTCKELYLKKNKTILNEFRDRDFRIINWGETETVLRELYNDFVWKNIL